MTWWPTSSESERLRLDSSIWMIPKETPMLHCFILSKESDWHFAVSHGHRREHLPTHLWGIIVVYGSILSEYHLLRTKSGWNIRKKGWNADAWVAEDGRPHGTTWRVIGWWPFLTSLFLPSLFRNTGASSLNRNSQSPLEQLDLDSKEIFQDWGDGSASHVFAISIWRSEFRAPAHISKDTVYSVSNSTLGDAVAGRSLVTLSSGSTRDPVLDNMVHHDWRWPLTSTPGLHRYLALPYTHTCIHIQINTDKNVKDEFCRHTKIIT